MIDISVSKDSTFSRSCTDSKSAATSRRVGEQRSESEGAEAAVEGGTASVAMELCKEWDREE